MPAPETCWRTVLNLGEITLTFPVVDTVKMLYAAESGLGVAGAAGTRGGVGAVNSRRTMSASVPAETSEASSRKTCRDLDKKEAVDGREPGGGTGTNSTLPFPTSSCGMALRSARPMAPQSHSSGASSWISSCSMSVVRSMDEAMARQWRELVRCYRF